MKFRSENKFNKIHSRVDSDYNKGTLKVFVLSASALLIISFFWISPIKQLVLTIGNFFGQSTRVAANVVGSVSTPIISKSSLKSENDSLREKLFQAQVDLVHLQALQADNDILRQTLGLETEKDIYTLHASVLPGAPNMSDDQMLIDKGSEDGVNIGDTITAYEHMPLGKVETVYDHSVLVTLFSANDKITPVLIGEKLVAGEARGKGLGSFEIKLPKGSGVNIEDAVILKGYEIPLTFGLVKVIDSSENSPFETIRISLPVNPNSVSYVGVLK